MADYVDRFMGAELAGLSGKINTVYGQAAIEIAKKLSSFIRAYFGRNQKKLEQLNAGKITKAEYQRWMMGQVFQGSQWRQKLKDVTNVYVNADKIARSLSAATNFNVFCEAANYTAYDICKHMGMGISFDIYDQNTVKRLLKDNPKMLPEWKIDEEKDYVWNEQRVQNAVTQGIIQGESIPEIGERLSGELASSNARKMELFARTAMTGAQNAGRVQRMLEAQEKRINVQKKWIATLDHRTRDAHQDLDGKTAAPDEPFKSKLGEILFPGDPTAEPANVYNCRCTLGYEYPEYASKGERLAYSDPDSRQSEVIPDMTYKEWKDQKARQVVNGFNGMEAYDFDRGVSVPTSQEIIDMVEDVNKNVIAEIPEIANYPYRVGYGAVEDGNIAITSFVYKTGIPGVAIALDPNSWDDLRKIDQVLAERQHVVTDKRDSVIYHEYGHMAVHIASMKASGYDGVGTLSPVQVKAVETYEDEILMNVWAIKKKYGDPISPRAKKNAHETAAEAFNGYFGGVRTDQVVEVFNYIKGVIQSGIV